MNTIEELENRYGIDRANGERMLAGYREKIGEIRGVIRVDDMEYVGIVSALSE